MTLQGKDQLKARMKAIGTEVFKPAGKQWADEVVRLSRDRVPNRDTRYSTGRLHDSIRRKTANRNKAIVTMRYVGYFVDAGTQGHGLNSRASRSVARGFRSTFSPKHRKAHPGYAARPFRARSARDALQRYPMSETVIKVWNKAA